MCLEVGRDVVHCYAGGDAAPPATRSSRSDTEKQWAAGSRENLTSRLFHLLCQKLHPTPGSFPSSEKQSESIAGMGKEAFIVIRIQRIGVCIRIN